jgi:AraC-like DNA-binding protein
MRIADLVFVYQLRDERQLAWHGRRHAHGTGLHEFHYFISGSGSFQNGRAVHRLEPGSLHASPPGLEHQVRAEDHRRPLSYYALLVDAAGDGELAELLEALPGSGPWPRRIGPSWRFFFAGLLEKHRSGKPQLEAAARHGLLAFLHELAAGGDPDFGAPTDAHVEKALALMQGAIEGSLDLESLAARLEVAPEHLVRLFTRRMGLPPMRYYGRLKIEAARAMLASTNLRVGEVADKLGFSNQFNFSRAFRREAGMSPSDWRDHCVQLADFAPGAVAGGLAPAALSSTARRQP